jgi:AcrR family transcriptional regulator
MATEEGRKQGSDVKASLRAAALKLWAEDGFDSVSVADICREADSTQAAFYYHFGSLSSLVVQTLRDELSSELLVDFLTVSIDSTWVVATQLVEAAFSQFTRFSSDLLLTAVRTGLFEPGLWEGFPGISRVVELLLRRGQARGEVRQDINIEEAARSIISLLLGVLLEWVMGLQDEDSAKLAIIERLRLFSDGTVTEKGRSDAVGNSAS